MRRRVFLLLFLVGWVLACAGGGARIEGEVEAWLQQARTGDDARALSGLRLPHDTPVPFGPEELGKRADRMRLLRDHDRVELTRVERIRSTVSRPGDPVGQWVLRRIAEARPVYEVQGLLWRGSESVDFSMRAHRDGLDEVRFGGARLIPRSTYHVVERPPPVDEAPALEDVELSFARYGDSPFVTVTGELDSRVERPGLTLTTTCEEGDRVYRHVTTSAHSDVGHVGWQSIELSDRVGPSGAPPPRRCDVELEVGEDERRLVRWCLEEAGFREGRCPIAPSPTGSVRGPVAVDEVWGRLGDDGLVVNYTLVPVVPMPPRYNSPDHATLYTEVDCRGGEVEAHRRPLNEVQHPAGLYRRLGSVLIPEGEALTPPCAVGLRYVRDDGFDREEELLWEGCHDGEALVPRPCP